MKQCAHCKEIKPLTEFAYANKILKTHQKHCRDCMREFNKVTYARRSEDKKEQVRLDKQKRIEEAKRYIWHYLSTHPCVDCGESDPVVLEFDHVKGTKTVAIADMPGRGYSLESIEREIRKTVVRCANCHRRKTSEERGWFRG